MPSSVTVGSLKTIEVILDAGYLMLDKYKLNKIQYPASRIQYRVINIRNFSS